VLDQIVKFAVSASMVVGESFTLIPRVIAITYVRNTGASFSLFEDAPVFMAVFNVLGSVMCIGVLAYIIMAKRKGEKWYLFAALAIIAAGGAGNTFDRLRQGYVVDMFEPLFVRFAVFNVADVGLTLGAAMMVLFIIPDMRNKQKPDKDESQS
jgi:signal peptidase II